MIIPWNTDAPLYHPPIATVGLIAVNTVVHLTFVTFADNPSAIEPWILQFGEGLHPLQWVTSNFLHINLMHLLSNMLFLWAFGLVVEGKLGWLRFLLTYFGLGIVESSAVQICMLGADKGGGLGASGVIFGLLAMAMVWAPKNEMNCILLISFRPIEFELAIVAFAGLYVLIEIVTAYFEGFKLSSATFHLTGALLGFVWGTFLVKSGRVDCEGWDLYTVLAGREGQKMKKKKKRRPKTAGEEEAARLQRDLRANVALEDVRQLLAQGQGRGAHALARKMSQSLANWHLPEDDALRLIVALDKDKVWPEVIEAMVDFLRCFPERSTRVRLKLAQILLREQKRPAQAMKVLAKLPAAGLNAQLERLRNQLTDQANRMQAQGMMELASEDW